MSEQFILVHAVLDADKAGMVLLNARHVALVFELEGRCTVELSLRDTEGKPLAVAVTDSFADLMTRFASPVVTETTPGRQQSIVERHPELAGAPPPPFTGWVDSQARSD